MTTTNTITARSFDLPTILDTAKVGHRVRSFDWKGSADCMEGVVTDVADLGSGCFKYTIDVDAIFESEFSGGDATIRHYENTRRTVTRFVQPWSKLSSDFHNVTAGVPVTVTEA